jgi:hypothetical protein
MRWKNNMTPKEFEQLVSQDPALAEPIINAARSITPRTRGTFGAAELAGIALFFPVVKYIIKNFGLPWLHEAKRYSELWRHKFHNWVNEQYSKHGMDPDEIEAAGEVLVKELEGVTDSTAQKSWERLAELLEKE